MTTAGRRKGAHLRHAVPVRRLALSLTTLFVAAAVADHHHHHANINVNDTSADHGDHHHHSLSYNLAYKNATFGNAVGTEMQNEKEIEKQKNIQAAEEENTTLPTLGVPSPGPPLVMSKKTEQHLLVDWQRHFSVNEIKARVHAHSLDLVGLVVHDKLERSSRSETMAKFYGMHGSFPGA